MVVATEEVLEWCRPLRWSKEREWRRVLRMLVTQGATRRWYDDWSKVVCGNLKSIRQTTNFVAINTNVGDELLEPGAPTYFVICIGSVP